MIVKKYYKLVRVSHEDSAYMRLKNVSNETGFFKMVKTGSPIAPNLEYSLDGVTWTSYDFTTLPEVAVAAGANIYFRGTNNNGFNNLGSYGSDVGSVSFYMDVPHNAYGNVQSINAYSTLETTTYKNIRKIFYNDTNLVSTKYLFLGGNTTYSVAGSTMLQSVFEGCTALVDGPDMTGITKFIGSTNGSWNTVASRMFYNCSALVTPPDLSNLTELNTRAADYMFYNCSALVTPPDFSNVTIIGDASCSNMFSGCSALVTPPDFSNVTEIATQGLYTAFLNCTALTYGPNLSNVTTVGNSVFAQCFFNCYNISEVTAPNIQNLDTNLLNNWLANAGRDATGTKTVRVPTGATIATGSDSGIPTGWTRVDY